MSLGDVVEGHSSPGFRDRLRPLMTWLWRVVQVIIGLAGMGLAGMMIWAFALALGWPTQLPVGTRAFVRHEQVVAVDQSAAEEMRDSIDAGDKVGVAELVRTRKAVSLRKGEAVLVLRVKFAPFRLWGNELKVRLLSGAGKGEAVWLNENNLTSSQVRLQQVLAGVSPQAKSKIIAAVDFSATPDDLARRLDEMGIREDWNRILVFMRFPDESDLPETDPPVGMNPWSR